MKDKRPPRKGGPKGGAGSGQKSAPRGGSGASFRKGGRDGTDGRREGRPPRESKFAGKGFGKDAGLPKRGARPPRDFSDSGQSAGNGGRFDRRTERPFRDASADAGSAGRSRGRSPYPPRDGGRGFDRDGGDSRERSYSSRPPGRRDGPPPRGPRRDVDRDVRTGERPDDRRDFARASRGFEKRHEGPAPRFNRDRDNDRSGADGNHRSGGGRPHRAPGHRSEKPRPGAEQRIVGREKARRAHSIGEDGALWLYGKHAVAAALNNPARKIKRLLAAEGALAWLASVGVARERIETAEQADSEEIDLLLHPGAVHQGLAALVEDLPRARLREECAPGDGVACVVVLDQITDPQNIGAIMRSAAAFGARAVIVQDRRTPPLAGALAKAAAGAVEQIACVKVVNVARAIEGLKDLGYFCAGLAGEAEAQIGAIPKGRPVALVLGAEGEGLRRLVADTCDGLYRIPIAAAIDSLNVSTAAAVSLFSVSGQGAGHEPR